MVGTHWLWVTPYRSMAASEASASKCSMTTDGAAEAVHPHAELQRGGVVEGAGDRYTELSVAPNTRLTSAVIDSAVPSRSPASLPLTPLGRPVVPEE